MFKPYGKRSVVGYTTASRLSDILDRFPTVYSGIQRIRLKHAHHRMVGPSTPLVLEAFPRSGSSFAHRAFVFSNPSCAKRIATHMHRATQIIVASRLQIPSLILVRHPREAVTSLIALAIHNGMLPMLDDKEARQCLRASLLRYALFHERIEDLPDLVVAGFEEVTNDFGKVISRVNSACETNFIPFEHNEENVKTILGATRRHLSPNSERNKIKKILKTAYDSLELRDLHIRCEATHERMLTRRDAQLMEGK